MAKNIRKPTTRKEPEDLIKAPPAARPVCQCARTEMPTVDICPACGGDIHLDPAQVKKLLRRITDGLAEQLKSPTAPTTRRH